MHKTATLGAILLSACANGPELKPAPPANEVAGDEAAAESTVANVHVVADAAAWEGFPEDLDAVLPMQVTIENRSDFPVRVRYGEFSLVGPMGTRLAALPPLKIEATGFVRAAGARQAQFEPGFGWDGFRVAEPYGPFYDDVGVWGGPFALDPTYYDTYYGRWPVDLPTQSMLEKALPEGVIEAGGRVRGFVYFEPVPEDLEPERLTFRYELVNAATEQQVGTVEIPFRVTD